MNKIRNHSIGVALTAATLAAVVLTGCGTETDECDDDAQSMSMVMKPGPASRPAPPRAVPNPGSVPRPAPNRVAPKYPAGPAKPAPVKPKGPKAPKVHVDFDDDCED